MPLCTTRELPESLSARTCVRELEWQCACATAVPIPLETGSPNDAPESGSSSKPPKIKVILDEPKWCHQQREHTLGRLNLDFRHKSFKLAS